MLDDGFVGTDGEDAREGAIVEFVGFELTAVLVYLDATILACAVFCIVADDVIEDIDQVDDLIRVFVGDRPAEDGEGRHVLQVARWRRLDGIVIGCSPEIHGRGVGNVGIHEL